MPKLRIPTNQDIKRTLAELNADADELEEIERIASVYRDAITTVRSDDRKRVVAACDKARTWVRWDRQLTEPQNHARAARCLLPLLGRESGYTLAMGRLGDAQYVFVIVAR